MKKQVKIVKYTDEDTGKELNGIQVGDELFDWSIGITEETAVQIKEKFQSDPEMVAAIRGETIRNFIKHFSEFVGKSITIKEINQAIENRFIEV